MAGNYPDYPNNRMAYHLDGTQVQFTNNDAGGVLSQLAGPTVAALNNELNTNILAQPRDDVNRLYFLFPEKRDITAYFYQTADGGDPIDSFQVWSSVDTTNGLDGTWVNTGATGATVVGSSVSHRTSIVTLPAPALGIVGLLFRLDTDFYDHGDLANVHIFGRTAAGENPDRLELWHPTLNQRVGPAHFDWGNAERASTAQIDFRVKNLSTTKVAGSTLIDFIAPTDSATAWHDAHQLTDDGGTTWVNSFTIPTLAAGAISPVYTIKRTLTGAQPLSLWAGYISAVPGTYA